MVATRGLPTRRDVDSFLSAGYSERLILEVVLAIAVKTLSNYSNHLFHTPVDELAPIAEAAMQARERRGREGGEKNQRVRADGIHGRLAQGSGADGAPGAPRRRGCTRAVRNGSADSRKRRGHAAGLHRGLE